MDQAAARRFLGVVAEVAAERLGAEHPCAAAAARAAEHTDPETVGAAQAALHALDAEARDAVMGEAHARLRADPAGILGAWQPRSGPAH